MQNLFNSLQAGEKSPVSYNEIATSLFGGKKAAFQAGRNESSVCFVEDTNISDYEAACEKLLSKGFSQTDAHMVRDNRFATFMREGLLLQVYHTEADHVTHLVFDPFTAVPMPAPVTENCENTADLYQFELDYREVNCGMFYVFRCNDGSFFLIDSAHFAADSEYLRFYRFLRRLTPDGRKIIIAGWFFTHAHQDHVCHFMSFLRAGFPDVEIQGVYYNFPSLDAPGNENWGGDDKRTMEELFALLKEHKEIPNYILHTGQRFTVRNLEMEVILTHEDMYPRPIIRFNDSSTLLSVTVAGSRVIFLGDSHVAESTYAVERYGRALKADIVQVAHHGFNAANVGIYYEIEPAVALYSSPRKNYRENLSFESNRVISRIVPEIYVSEQGTAHLHLPYVPGTAELFAKEIPTGDGQKLHFKKRENQMNRIFKDGMVVLFQGDSITDTHRDKETNIGLGEGYPPKIKEIYDNLFPGNTVTFINRGVSGNTTRQMLDRYDADVLAVKPDFISILIGINDIWRHISNVMPTSPELLEQSYRTFLSNIKRDFPNTPIMIIEPYLLLSDPEKESWLPLFNANLLTIRKLAREFADYYVPLQSIFDKYISEGMSDLDLSEDGVHPTQAGHGIIAYEYLKAIGVL